MKRLSIGTLLVALSFISLTDFAAFPMISPIPNQTFPLGTRSTETLQFEVKDDATPPEQIVLTYKSNNPDLVPENMSNIILGGKGSWRTVRVVPVSGKWGTATVTITATDNDGDTDVESFDVEVVRTISP